MAFDFAKEIKLPAPKTSIGSLLIPRKAVALATVPLPVDIVIRTVPGCFEPVLRRADRCGGSF
jgi:hypothetical protein